MNRPNDFRNIRFDRQKSETPRRIAIAIGVTLGVYTLLWLIVPHNVLYWLLAPVLAGLVLVACLGWRPALSQIIDLLLRLEEL